MKTSGLAVITVLAATAVSAQKTQAQELTWRLWQPSPAAARTAAMKRGTLYTRSSAQVSPLPQGTIGAPSASSGTVEPGSGGLPTVRPSNRRPVTVYVDTRLGFDKQTTVADLPLPTEVNVRRRIRSVAVTAEYPIASRTSVFASVPYIDQTTNSRTAFGNFRQSGRGIGDIALFVERSIPAIARGTDASLSVGLQFPTGSDPYSVGPNELATGVGFYQGLMRASIRKLRVPLSLYAAVDYGRSLSSRNVGGARIRLPASYGGEVGFYYSMGPEFTSQTALSYSRQSSPFLLDSGSSTAYLTQSLNFRSGTTTSLRASVDVGLTEDSTDMFLGLSGSKQF